MSSAAHAGFCARLNASAPTGLAPLGKTACGVRDRAARWSVWLQDMFREQRKITDVFAAMECCKLITGTNTSRCWFLGAKQWKSD